MKDTKKKMAMVVAKGLKKVLKLEANSTSSIVAYQPKAPRELRNFKDCK